MNTATVRAYYERNTRLFRTFSLGRRARALHRAIWADGARDYAGAMRYLHTQIHDALTQHAAASSTARVLDIGCGVGGTLLDLATTFDGELRAVGISISPTQVQIANIDATAQGLAGRCTFLEADYMELPFAGSIDLAFAIESLVHAPDIACAISEAANALAPGGELIICDDMLTGAAPPDSAHWIAAFQRGWHAPGLTSVAMLTEIAASVGLRLVERRILTQALRLVHLPDRFVTPLLQLSHLLPARYAFTQSLIGGLALQHCLRRGVIDYCWLRFVK